MDNKIMEGQVMEGVTKSNGGKAVGLVLGALGVLGGITAAAIYKKKKNGSKVEETEVVEDNESNNEE